MKHKTWFRLVIKAIGVYMIVTTIPTIFSQVSWYVIYYATLDAQAPDQWPWMLHNFLHWGFQLALGLYLLFGGKWIVNKVIPSNRPYCPECGYELSKASGGNCPECGAAHELASRDPGLPR